MTFVWIILGLLVAALLFRLCGGTSCPRCHSRSTLADKRPLWYTCLECQHQWDNIYRDWL